MIGSVARPSVTAIVAGAPSSVASWLAASSVLYCAGVGAAGEPSFCHAVKALLCVVSTR